MHRWIAVALGIVALSGCELERPSLGGERGARQKAKVVRAVDGDTIDVRIGSHEETVRLIGVDTPETVRPGAPVECGGPEASDAMKALAEPGDRVRLIGDSTQDDEDRYGRLLRYVEERGRDLGKAQVKAGHAEVYVYGGNPFKRTGRYRRAAKRAQSSGAGVWGACGGDFHSGS